MHPDYAKRVKENANGEPFTFRMNPDVRTELDKILSIEGGHISHLVIEGMFRVIDDRHSDHRYQALSARALELQRQLDEVRAQLHEKPE